MNTKKKAIAEAHLGVGKEAFIIKPEIGQTLCLDELDDHWIVRRRAATAEEVERFNVTFISYIRWVP